MVFCTIPSFNNATTCHICTKPLTDDKVRDHCHIVGSYRGAAHSEYNLMYSISKSGWKLPVVTHNLKGGDGHLLVKALKSEFGKVRVIPQNMAKYLSVTVGQSKFIDSFQFAPKGIDVFAKSLAGDEFRYFRESCTSNQFGLIRRKCVYPYEYMDSSDRFDETKLLSQDVFFSKLSGSPRSDSEFGLGLWNVFGCRTMADYHDIFLQLDVLLLADLFERFRTTCLQSRSVSLLHHSCSFLGCGPQNVACRSTTYNRWDFNDLHSRQ